MELAETGYKVVDRIELAQDRVQWQGFSECSTEPFSYTEEGNSVTSYVTVNFFQGRPCTMEMVRYIVKLKVLYFLQISHLTPAQKSNAW